MLILDRLIEDFLHRSEIRFSSVAISISLHNNSVRIKGEIPVTVVDTEKPANPKVLAHIKLPLDANIQVKEMTFPIPTLQ